MAQAPARCLNHPERNAVARCKECHKPLCSKCVKRMPEGAFCSDECYQKMGAFQKRVEVLDQQKKRGIQWGTWVTRLVMVAVVAAVLYYVFVVRSVRGVGDLVDLIKGFIP